MKTQEEPEGDAGASVCGGGSRDVFDSLLVFQRLEGGIGFLVGMFVLADLNLRKEVTGSLRAGCL